MFFRTISLPTNKMEIKFLFYLIKHWWLLNLLMPLLTKCSTLGPEGLYTAAEDMSIQCAQNCTGWWGPQRWLRKRMTGLWQEEAGELPGENRGRPLKIVMLSICSRWTLIKYKVFFLPSSLLQPVALSYLSFSLTKVSRANTSTAEAHTWWKGPL